MPYGSKTVETCVRRVKQGESMADVARVTGVSKSTISVWCKNAGISSKNSKLRWTEEELQIFEDLWKHGMSYGEIAMRLGRSERGLFEYACRHRDRFPRRSKNGAQYMKERITMLEAENHELRKLLDGFGVHVSWDTIQNC